MRSMNPMLIAVVCVTTVFLAGCQSASAGAPRPVATPQDSAEQGTSTAAGMVPDPAGPVSAVPSTTTHGAPPSTAAPRTTTAKTTTPARFTVLLDPGHNGANAAHPEVINQQVPAGRGQTKPCNTVGTSTDAGYAEHVFTWDVALRVRNLLTARGVRVVLARSSDTGVGPCVNERAAIGNAVAADAVVSIHADGSAADARGFHVAYSSPPLNAAQGEPARLLAVAMRDAMTGAGFPTSDYLGSGGLLGRDDLAGLNLSVRPAVLVECANMRNPSEAAAVSSASGRARYAAAIAAGILRWLGA
jgi:N-acetylmuramoyl-L-alanine amidase